MLQVPGALRARIMEYMMAKYKGACVRGWGRGWCVCLVVVVVGWGGGSHRGAGRVPRAGESSTTPPHPPPHASTHARVHAGHRVDHDAEVMQDLPPAIRSQVRLPRMRTPAWRRAHAAGRHAPPQSPLMRCLPVQLALLSHGSLLAQLPLFARHPLLLEDIAPLLTRAVAVPGACVCWEARGGVPELVPRGSVTARRSCPLRQQARSSSRTAT